MLLTPRAAAQSRKPKMTRAGQIGLQKTAMRFSELSLPRQALVRECQRLGFGEILRFFVHAGEPVFTAETEIIYDMKLDGDDGPWPQQNLPDFELRRQVLRLFAEMDSMREGVVESLIVHNGLPHRIRLKAAETK
jgi:hypothetical protein